MTLPAPRLFSILARKANQAIVLRRGPSKHVASFLWNLEDDSFTLGQWFLGRLYERRCDLSPCGKNFLYFAANGAWKEGESREAFTAISRAPYLTPIDLWHQQEGDAWNGGGLFTTEGGCWLNIPQGEPARKKSELIEAYGSPYGEAYGKGDSAVYFARLERDGWSIKGERDDEESKVTTVVLERALEANWYLRKESPVGEGLPETHTLFHKTSGTLLPMPTWEWAEWDAPRKRLLWAEDGKLMAAGFAKGNFGVPQTLKDFSQMSFEFIKTPPAFRR